MQTRGERWEPENAARKQGPKGGFLLAVAHFFSLCLGERTDTLTSGRALSGKPTEVTDFCRVFPIFFMIKDCRLTSDIVPGRRNQICSQSGRAYLLHAVKDAFRNVPEEP